MKSGRRVSLSTQFLVLCGLAGLSLGMPGDIATSPGTAVEAHVTAAMVAKAMERGKPFFDPKNGSYVYVLSRAMASGKDLMVSANLQGVITTVLTGSNLTRARFIPLP